MHEQYRKFNKKIASIKKNTNPRLKNTVSEEFK